MRKTNIYWRNPATVTQKADNEIKLVALGDAMTSYTNNFITGHVLCPLVSYLMRNALNVLVSDKTYPAADGVVKCIMRKPLHESDNNEHERFAALHASAKNTGHTKVGDFDQVPATNNFTSAVLHACPEVNETFDMQLDIIIKYLFYNHSF